MKHCLQRNRHLPSLLYRKNFSSTRPNSWRSEPSNGNENTPEAHMRLNRAELSRDSVFYEILHEKLEISREHIMNIRQDRDFRLLEKEQWRSIAALPDDFYLDQEAGRLLKCSDVCIKPLLAQRDRGYDFQINEVSKAGKILVLQRGRGFFSAKDHVKKEAMNKLMLLVHCDHVSTVQALSKISEYSNIPIERIGVRQVFDRTTVNTQLYSVDLGENPSDYMKWVDAINESKDLHIHVSPVGQSAKHVMFGSHGGNYFSLLVRHCKAPIQTMHSHSKVLEDGGFINYYPQRYFGYGSFGNHLVGTAAVQGRYDQALAMVAQDECEACRNVDSHLGFNKGFFVNSLPWLKSIIDCFADSTSDDDTYREVYMKLPPALRWKHLLAVRCYAWNLLASARVDENREKVVGDLIGSGTIGVSALPADCFETFDAHRHFVRRLKDVKPNDVQTLGNTSSISADEQHLHDVVLPFGFGTLGALSPKAKELCRLLKLPSHAWNKYFGFPNDPIVEHRPITSIASGMNMYSMPETYCSAQKIDIGIKIDAELSPGVKFQSCAQRLPGKLYDIALSRNTLLGKWGKIGSHAYLLGFRGDPCVHYFSALREIIHLNRPYDESKTLRSYIAKKQGATPRMPSIDDLPDIE